MAKIKKTNRNSTTISSAHKQHGYTDTFPAHELKKVAFTTTGLFCGIRLLQRSERSPV